MTEYDEREVVEAWFHFCQENPNKTCAFKKICKETAEQFTKVKCKEWEK